MDEKQTRMLVWMTGALLALVALLVLVQPPKDDDEDEAWTRAWPAVEAGQVQRIRIALRGEAADAPAVELERRDGAWRLVAPVEAPADEEAADRLARALAELEVGEPLEGGDLAAYGLDAPAGTVRFELEGGEAHEVRVGDDAPVGWSSYVLLDDEAVARTSRSRLSSRLLKSADDLRSRVVVDLSPSAVQRVEIAPVADGTDVDATDEGGATGAGAVVIRRDDHGWWVESDGVARRADGDAVRDLLRALADLRVDRWPEGPVELPGPALRVRLDLGAPEPDASAEGPVELVLGAVEDGGRLVRGPEQPGPVRVLTVDLDRRLDGLPDDLVSDRLVEVRRATVERVDLALGEVAFAATREEGAWDSAAAEAVLDALADARADRTAAVEATGEPWGHVELVEGNRTERVELYQEVDGGRVARDAAGGPDFLVPATEIARLVDAAGDPPTGG